MKKDKDIKIFGEVFTYPQILRLMFDDYVKSKRISYKTYFFIKDLKVNEFEQIICKCSNKRKKYYKKFI